MNASGGMPSLESLTPRTPLFSFVSNPNVQPDGEGNYFIDYGDPNYINTGEAYTSGATQPGDLGVLVRINFSTRTATLEMDNIPLDVSRNYFPD